MIAPPCAPPWTRSPPPPIRPWPPDVSPPRRPRATGQLAKAQRVIEVTPTDLTSLLVHLTVTRTLVTEGWGPPDLARCLSAAIARVHYIAQTTPEVFH